MNKDERDVLLGMQSITKTEKGYELQAAYNEEDGKIKPVVPYQDRDTHDCFQCAHFRWITACDGNCLIYENLQNSSKDVSLWGNVAWARNIVNCAAYDRVYRINVINSLDEMITFIKRSRGNFSCIEDFEDYYGFQRAFDEDTGEILETIDEYYQSGKRFDKTPDKYPSVIYFDPNKNGLEWRILEDMK